MFCFFSNVSRYACSDNATVLKYNISFWILFVYSSILIGVFVIYYNILNEE